MKLSDLSEFPGHLLRRAQQANWLLFAEEMKGIDITSVQYAALVAIAEHPGVEATTLASLIFFDRATIGGVVGRLVDKGLVVRQGSATDRRVKELFLTRPGRTLLATVHERVALVQQRLLAPYSPKEREQLLRLLKKLVLGVTPKSIADLAPPEKTKKRAATTPRKVCAEPEPADLAAPAAGRAKARRAGPT